MSFLGYAGSVAAADTNDSTLHWVTNGPAVFARKLLPLPANSTNSPPPTNVFDHFVPDSLNYLIWTNFIAHTNGRDTAVWTSRSHPIDWPARRPSAVWATNSLLWGMRGMTGLSPCWESEGAPGQVPVTALTRRHVYARGHGMGPDGFNTNFLGRKIWFFTANNTPVEVRAVRDVVRTWGGGGKADYTILLLDRDLPASIQPLRVVAPTNVPAFYPFCPGAPRPLFKTEQTGHVSADVPGFTLNTWKGGDSGAPDMLPMPGELVFFGGRSTSGPSPQMQADMDQLCQLQGLDPKRYQLQWLDLSAFRSY